MSYANHAFQYDHYDDRDEQELRKANQKAERATRATRKRARKRDTATPDCGIGARRNRRWAW